MDWLNNLRNLRMRRHLRTSRYRAALAELPPGLEAAWRQGASTEFPGIPSDALFFARAAEGLFGFFDAVTTRGAVCALPSLAADSVWHAWLAHDPQGLARCCRRHFGAAVPHQEAAGLEQGALARALVACRALEGMPAHGPALPRLFTLDARLRMPRGHGYWTEGGEVAYARLDASGRRPGAAWRQPELAGGAAGGRIHYRRGPCGGAGGGAAEAAGRRGRPCRIGQRRLRRQWRLRGRRRRMWRRLRRRRLSAPPAAHMKYGPQGGP